MTLDLDNVDKNSFKSIFTEDIYIIQDQTSSNKSKVTPLPNTKQYGVVLNNEVELTTFKDLLVKILQSIKVDFMDVDFIFGETPLQKGSYKTLFSFGTPSSVLQLNFKEKLYEVMEEGDHKYLFIDSIGEIEKTLDKKKLLWAALKKLI